jgi:Rieske 2Fe-2S protein
MADHTVCSADELPEGEMRLVEVDGVEIGVFNCGGDLLAIEDRCSHDDGPLAEGIFDQATCTVECPRPFPPSRRSRPSRSASRTGKSSWRLTDESARDRNP